MPSHCAASFGKGANCLHVLFFFPFPDRETDGAGATGVAQHAQEAGVVSAGSAGCGHGEETCKEPEELLLSCTMNSRLLLLRNSLIRPRPKGANIRSWHLASIGLTNECAAGTQLHNWAQLLLYLYQRLTFFLLILLFGHIFHFVFSTWYAGDTPDSNSLSACTKKNDKVAPDSDYGSQKQERELKGIQGCD